MTVFRNVLLAGLLAIVPGCLDIPEWKDPLRDAGSSQKDDAEQVYDADAQQQYDSEAGYDDAGNPPACPLGEQRTFYNGPDGTVSIGNCRAGLETCLDQDEALTWIVVRNEITPHPERCDGSDANCNGVPNEGYDVGSACEVGVGACISQGQKVCAPNGLETRCDAPIIEPQLEKCDDSDADCDGVANNGYDVGAACEVGVGTCRTEGVKVCDLNLDARVTLCDAPIITPGEEACNGVDDDCDGETDEGLCKNLVGYVCDANGNKDICVIQFDGQHKVNLTNRAGEDWNGEYADPVLGGRYRPSPSFSPDGRRLAYVAGDNETIRIKNILTGEEEILPGTAGARLVSFSPDGTKIALARGGERVVVIYDLQNQREEWRGNGYTPSWGLDGTLVWGGGLIYLKAPNGETREFLIDNEGYMPKMSPDGTGLLYVYIERGGRWNGIHYIGLNGQEREETDGAKISPLWMSNGTDYLFSVLNGEIHKRQLGVAGEQNLATGEMPALSSDNQWMVYVSSRHGTKDLFIKSLDGLVERRLTDDPGEEESPAFAPVAR